MNTARPVTADTLTAEHARAVLASALEIPNYCDADAAEWVLDEGRNAPLHARERVIAAYSRLRTKETP